MIRLAKLLGQDRRGNVIAVAAASLPLLIGSAGLAVDTIQWALWKRQLQRAADSAALAGVYAKVQGADYSTAVTADLAHNNHVGIAGAVTPSSPPPSGPYVSDQNAVRVVLAVQRKLGFSSLFLSTPPTIRASATATITPKGDYCVISLESTPTTGITADGSANLNLGCGMVTNSTAGVAAVATGSAVVNASPIAAVGGIPPSSNWGSSTLIPHTIEQLDPLADVNPAAPSGICPDVLVEPNQTVTLSPGCYGNMVLKGTVTLQAGTYVLDGGGLQITSTATVDGTAGVTFVLTSRTPSDPSTIKTVTIDGSSQTRLVAPGTGDYAGIVIYQDRGASDSGVENVIAGGSASTFQGAFYFPGQAVTFTGSSGLSTDCMQIVARRVRFTGSTSISNSCSASSGASSFEGRAVRLVE